MNRKTFWLLITVIAIACIVLPAASSAYNALTKDKSGQVADKQDAEEKDEEHQITDENSSEQQDIIPSEQNADSEQKYTVEYGDNLWLIATKFDVSIEAIIQTNNLSSETLVPGQELLIPVPGTVNVSPPENRSTSSSRGQSGTDSHVVRSGESLWSIALKYRISVETLKEINGLTGDQIHPGMTLKIAGSGSPSRQQDNSPSEPAPQPEKDKAPSPERKEKPSTKPQPKSSVLETAEQFLGVPYKYGGSSPSGFDCSGFVKYVYGLHGIKIPRVAADQAKAGSRVDTPSVGDLVFFAENGSVVHVGIYAGNNNFIHANIKQGVIFTSLDQEWYKKRYVGANRY